MSGIPSNYDEAMAEWSAVAKYAENSNSLPSSMLIDRLFWVRECPDKAEAVIRLFAQRNAELERDNKRMRGTLKAVKSLNQAREDVRRA